MQPHHEALFEKYGAEYLECEEIPQENNVDAEMKSVPDVEEEDKFEEPILKKGQSAAEATYQQVMKTRPTL